MSGERAKVTAAGNWGLLRAGVQPRGGLEIPTMPTDSLHRPLERFGWQSAPMENHAFSCL